MIIDIEAIADSVHVRFNEKVTVILDRGDAAQFGLKLLQVSSLGGDTLDEPIDKEYT